MAKFEKLETYEIPFAEISIDENATDWENVPVFREYSDLGIKIKIARDEQKDVFYMYIEGLAQDFDMRLRTWYKQNSIDHSYTYYIWNGQYAEVKDSAGNRIALEIKWSNISYITEPRAIIDIWIYNAGKYRYEELKFLSVSNK